MPADVRMSGFRSRATVGEALRYVDGLTSQHMGATEVVSIEVACDRVLAEAVTSTINVPSFDRSAMDGFAVIAEETDGASDYNPLPFHVVGASMPDSAFSGELQAGHAVQIMTGAPIPAGATAVVPAEYAKLDGEVVELTQSVSPSKHIGRTGEDIKVGNVVLPAGRRLRPQDVGVLTSVGIAKVDVVRQPVVRILVTGNELAMPGQEKSEHQIYEANSYLLRGLIARDGGLLEEPISRVKDTREDIQQALTAPGADVILISGGTSVGAEDFAPLIVAKLGELGIHGIAMRPSSPTGLGKIGNAVVCLLPGNPVSCMCAYDFFAGRAIRTLAGRDSDWPHRTVEGILIRKVASSIGRVDYCRVTVREDDNGQKLVEPLAISGASILSSTTRADGFIIVPEASEGMGEGQSTQVYLYDS